MVEFSRMKKKRQDHMMFATVPQSEDCSHVYTVCFSTSSCLQNARTRASRAGGQIKNGHVRGTPAHGETNSQEQDGMGINFLASVKSFVRNRFFERDVMPTSAKTQVSCESSR